MWLLAYDAFPFLTTSSNHDFTILLTFKSNLWLRLVQLLLFDKNIFFSRFKVLEYGVKDVKSSPRTGGFTVPRTPFI